MRSKDRRPPKASSQPAAHSEKSTRLKTFTDSSLAEFSDSSTVSIQSNAHANKGGLIDSSPTQNAVQLRQDKLTSTTSSEANNRELSGRSAEGETVQRALPAGSRLESEGGGDADSADPKWDVLVAVLDEYNRLRAALEKEVFQVEAAKQAQDSKEITTPDTLVIFRNQCEGALEKIREVAADWQQSANQNSGAASAQKQQSLALILKNAESEKAELADTALLAAEGKSRVEQDSKDEDWDVADAAEATAVQVALPTVEQFSQQTNAGVFARRDDQLKQIDAQLKTCNWAREAVYRTDIWESKKDSDENKGSASHMERMMGYVESNRKDYQSQLKGLQTAVSAWLSQFAGDNSSSVVHRRGPIEALQQAIKSELQSTAEQRVLAVNEKEDKAKAAEEVSSRTLFTADEFKASAKAWVIIPFTSMSDVVTGLQQFHAIKDDPADDKIRLQKIELAQSIQDAASDANQSIVRLKEHPGYQKGHAGFEKTSHADKQNALRKVMSQCIKYKQYHRTQEEKDKIAAEVKASIDAQNRAAMAQWSKR